MKTIVITSQKGGSGKTTLAAHLAVETERLGHGPSWLIDADRQGTLTLWHNRRVAPTPARLDVALPKLQIGLDKLALDGARFCFIDTAPTISEQTAVIVGLADLVVIPVRPSPADLWAVAETVELVKAHDKPFLFVLTQAKSHANITAQAVAALSQHGRVAQAFIADRVHYAVAMTGGKTAPELSPNGPAAGEIAALWQEVNSCFHEKVKSRKVAAHG